MKTWIQMYLTQYRTDLPYVYTSSKRERLNATVNGIELSGSITYFVPGTTKDSTTEGNYTWWLNDLKPDQVALLDDSIYVCLEDKEVMSITDFEQSQHVVATDTQLKDYRAQLYVS